MVFYFTATGNSLYVAKQFSDAPISIPQIMRGRQWLKESGVSRRPRKSRENYINAWRE